MSRLFRYAHLWSSDHYRGVWVVSRPHLIKLCYLFARASSWDPCTQCGIVGKLLEVIELTPCNLRGLGLNCPQLGGGLSRYYEYLLQPLRLIVLLRPISSRILYALNSGHQGKPNRRLVPMPRVCLPLIYLLSSWDPQLISSFFHNPFASRHPLTWSRPKRS